MFNEVYHMGITEDIARFVVKTNFRNLPQEVIEAARRSILDCLGVMLAGSSENPSRMLRKAILQKSKGTGVSTVVNSRHKTNPRDSAFLNGFSAHLLDLDDNHSLMLGHPTAPVLPVVLSVGEEVKATGEDAVTAFVLGVEVECRLGEIVNPSHYQRGWHSTGTLGTFGSTVAVGKLLGFDAEKIAHSLGVAASLSSGMRRNFGTLVKPLHVAQAAQNGVMISELIGMGFTADKDIFSGKDGFINLYSNQKHAYKLRTRLGKPFSIVKPGVDFKKYPCCSGTHAAIDAILDLIKGSSITPKEIKKIRCGITPLSKDELLKRLPKDGLEGKFSIEYTLALALTEGKLGLQHFKGKIRPDIKKLMNLVDVYVHPDFEGEYINESAHVAIRTRDGKKIEKRVMAAKGKPENLLTWRELIEKYKECAGRVLSSKDANELLHRAQKIEKLNCVIEITEMLKGKHA